MHITENIEGIDKKIGKSPILNVVLLSFWPISIFFLVKRLCN